MTSSIRLRDLDLHLICFTHHLHGLTHRLQSDPAAAFFEFSDLGKALHLKIRIARIALAPLLLVDLFHREQFVAQSPMRDLGRYGAREADQEQKY
jgi:hypothetical protein